MSVFRDGSNLDFDATRNSFVLGRGELLRIRAKALRRGLWFKVLSGVERTMVNLAIRVVRGCVKSSMLARLMMGVVVKLREAMESRFVRMAREVGRPLACRLSRVAVAWGNKSAFLWARDTAFIRYVTMMCMSSPEAFR